MIDLQGKTGVKGVGPNEVATPPRLTGFLKKKLLPGVVAFFSDDAAHLRKEVATIGKDLAGAGGKPKFAMVYKQRVLGRIAVEHGSHDAIAGGKGVRPLFCSHCADCAVGRHEIGGRQGDRNHGNDHERYQTEDFHFNLTKSLKLASHCR